MRRIRVTAALVCLIGGFTGASAQPSQPLGIVTCEAAATPAAVSSNGGPQPAGDIVLLCENIPTPGGDGSNRLTVDIVVSFSTTLAQHLDGDLTDAVLTINQNDCETPSSAGSTFGGCGAPSSDIQDPQRGALAAPNRLEWQGVDVPVPGASVSGVSEPDCSTGSCFPSITVIRVSGLRAAIDDLPVSASVSIIGAPTVNVVNSVMTVGHPVATAEVSHDNPPISETGTVSCASTANPAMVDPQGDAEPIGTILLRCVAVPPDGGTTAPGFHLDLVVEGNVDIAGGSLTIDGDEAQSFDGAAAAPNQVRFPDVFFPIPPGGQGGEVEMVIRGLTANVAQLGIPGEQTFPSTQATASLAVDGAQLPIGNSVLHVGAPIGPNPEPAEADLTIPMACEATAVPPDVRAQDIAAVQGDLVLTCTHSGPLPAEPATVTADISVSLNVNVTNNIGFAGGDVTDAVLIVNENNCNNPASAGATFGGCGAHSDAVQDPQLGRLVAPNRLLWENVQVPVPGADPDDDGPAQAFPLFTTLRIAGIRANASQLGIPETATFPASQVTAYLGVGRTFSLTATANIVNAGAPILGMTSALDGDPLLLAPCEVGGSQAGLQASEGFATAFKVQGAATAFPGNVATESGYFVPGSNNGAGASQATRILLRFSGVPSGIVLDVPQQINNGSAGVDGDALELRLLADVDERGAGGSLTQGEGNAAVPLTQGAGIAVYEVIDSAPFNIDEVLIPIHVSGAATGGFAPARVQALLAPLSAVIVASGPEPEPRFVDVGGDGEIFLQVEGQPCAGGSAALGVFTDGAWFIDRNGDFQFDADTELVGWGSPGDIPVRGDWNGDGFRDLGVFSNGAWFIDTAGDGVFNPATDIKGWGAAGWIPMPGDWNGDGVTDLGVVDPATMAWFIDLNGDGVFDPATELVGWGSPGDIPVVGDWNGDGRDSVGVFSNGLWFIDRNADGGFDPATEMFGWGAPGWTPIVGDWNGDGTDKLGAIDPSTMAWFRDVNGDFLFDPGAEILGWGSPGDTPVVADWNGDGADNVGVFSGGLWFIDLNGDSAFDGATEMFGWGVAGWTPTPGAWKP